MGGVIRFWICFEVDLLRFADGVDVEYVRKTGVRGDLKIFGLIN